MLTKNNTENIERSWNSLEGRLPPSPKQDGSLERVDESPNDTDSNDEYSDYENIDEVREKTTVCFMS